MRRIVVHFTDSTAVGGAERMLLTAIAALDPARWDQILMHPDNSAVAEIAEEARQLGAKTRAIPARSGVRGITGIPEIASMLREERCAVFHAHLPWTLRCTRGIVAARIARIPAIVASQQLYQLPHERGPRAKQALVSRFVDRYIAVSSAMGEELRSVVAHPDRVAVIHNTIEPKRFESAAGDVRATLDDGGRSIVLTLARLDFQKGLETLIEAAALVPDVLFLIAGDGPERARLEAEAEALGVAERVRFLGRREDVPELLAACDVFVLPSLFEGLPVSVLEAMAAGRPVVATSVPGTAEAVADGETGILVSPSDPELLARAIRQVTADPAMARRMGDAGRTRVRRLFSADEMGRKLDSLYQELLG